MRAQVEVGSAACVAVSIPWLDRPGAPEGSLMFRLLACPSGRCPACDEAKAKIWKPPVPTPKLATGRAVSLPDVGDVDLLTGLALDQRTDEAHDAMMNR
jgi:hypothetical protein